MWPSYSNSPTSTTLGNLFFFSAANDAGNTEANFEPWVSDGTELGTSMIKDIELSGGSDPHSFVAGETVVYFVANGHIWTTNGTESGTRFAYDPESGPSVAALLLTIGDTLYFHAYDSDNISGLWKTDGSKEGAE